MGDYHESLARRAGDRTSFGRPDEYRRADFEVAPFLEVGIPDTEAKAWSVAGLVPDPPHGYTSVRREDQ